MDVTSLLNTSNVAAEQQKQEERPTVPSRNRTPWDAGGYSLPINTLNHSAISNFPNFGVGDGAGQYHPIHLYDSQLVDSSKSPHHKFSDSRSSLSSFTSTTNSTTNSTTHSRYSSMSTVNSNQPFVFPNNTNNIFLEKSTESSRGSESSTTPQIGCHSEPASPASPHDTRGVVIASPTESLDALAAIAEQHLSQKSPNNKYRSQSLAAFPSAKMLDEIDSIKLDADRPGSPSDAMLIKRNRQAENSDNGEVSDRSDNERSSQNLRAPSTHRRNISAPDFAAILPNATNASSQNGRAQSGSVDASAASPAPDHQREVGSSAGSAYDVEEPPQALIDDTVDLNAPIVCMYMENCDTGSQPRKAISHIFGRNKMCTRLIPQSVWVHYCRKHYQRSRYRNPKEYAKLQCDLVQSQIRRVHDWSEQNLNHGEPGVVQDWGLAVRKREQKRLDELAGSNRKRRATFDHDDDADGDEDGGANSRPPTAVPDWLLGLCGKGYTTTDILGIFNRLHNEILDDLMPCFPDIEILPNIIVDQDEPKSPRGYAKRKPASNTHKRSQSLGGSVGLRPQASFTTPDRRMSQPVWTGPNSNPNPTLQSAAPGGMHNSPLKRRRGNESMETVPSQQFPQNFSFGRRQPASTHRPVFNGIDENSQIDLDQNRMRGNPMMRGRSYGSHSGYQAPLAAPIPQRVPSRLVSNQYDTTNELTMRGSRSTHQRSQSDMTFPNRGPMHPAMTGPTYTPNPDFQLPQYQQSGYPGARPYQNRSSYQPMQYDVHNSQGHHLQATQQQMHARQNSSPMIQQHLSSPAPPGSVRRSPSVVVPGNTTPTGQTNAPRSATNRSVGPPNSRNRFDGGANGQRFD